MADGLGTAAQLAERLDAARRELAALPQVRSGSDARSGAGAGPSVPPRRPANGTIHPSRLPPATDIPSGDLRNLLNRSKRRRDEEEDDDADNARNNNRSLARPRHDNNGDDDDDEDDGDRDQSRRRRESDSRGSSRLESAVVVGSASHRRASTSDSRDRHSHSHSHSQRDRTDSRRRSETDASRSGALDPVEDESIPVNLHALSGAVAVPETNQRLVSAPRVLPTPQDSGVRQRNQRLFGSMMSTLQRFKEHVNSSTLTEQARKREEILAKVEGEQIRRTEQAQEERKRIVVERRAKQLEVEKLHAELDTASQIEAAQNQYNRTRHFIRTQAEPPVFYLPITHNARSLNALAESGTNDELALAATIKKIKERHATVIAAIEERHAARNQRIAERAAERAARAEAFRAASGSTATLTGSAAAAAQQPAESESDDEDDDDDEDEHDVGAIELGGESAAQESPAPQAQADPKPDQESSRGNDDDVDYEA